MTSSQPVVTPQAINFTPDNLRCYAYSGVVSVDNTEKTVIEFNTNTEYLRAFVLFNYYDNDADAYRCQIKFNDVAVQGFVYYGKKDYKDNSEVPVPLIIPPFTNVKLTLDNIDNSNERSHIVSITGEAFGMTETGYQ